MNLQGKENSDASDFNNLMDKNDFSRPSDFEPILDPSGSMMLDGGTTTGLMPGIPINSGSGTRPGQYSGTYNINFSY